VIELAPGIHRVPVTPADLVNVFLFEEPSGELTLVDAGVKGSPKRVLAAIEALGRSPADVTRIVLTHAHADHAGGAARMQAATGGRVHAHADDEAYVRDGRVPPRDRRSILGRLLQMLPDGFAPLAVDEVFTDGGVLDVAGGLRVVHTPGHSPGHVSLFHEGSGVLLTGDALFNWTRRIQFSPRFFCTDIPMSRETAFRLGDLDFETVAFMHGPEIRDDAQRRVQDFLARRITGRE